MEISAAAPIGRRIADFACPAGKLVIELDGGQHDSEREADDRRNAELARHGYRVIRFCNNEVLENLDGILETISGILGNAPTSPNLSAPKQGAERGRVLEIAVCPDQGSATRKQGKAASG